MKQLSNKYPFVKINHAYYDNLVSILKNEREFKCSQVLRSIINGILSEEIPWDNATSMYTPYSKELAACLGYYISIVTEFTFLNSFSFKIFCKNINPQHNKLIFEKF